MTGIIILVLLGIFLLFVEFFLIPGITLAGIGAFVSCGVAVWLGFERFGMPGGFLTLAVSLVLAIVMLLVFLRPRMWRRFTLKDDITGAAQELPTETGVKVGDKGMTVTRLAPMGKVDIDGRTYEAKTTGIYIDQQQEVEVIGFENFNVVVKKAAKP